MAVVAMRRMSTMEEDDATELHHLKESVESNPNDPSRHLSLALFLWERGSGSRGKAAEHFVLAAKLNPQNGEAFKYLGHYYREMETQRALKCYQRAVSLNPNDSASGEALCDLLDIEGKESLELSVCRDASVKSPRAFWAFRRLGFLLVHQKKWSEAVQSLQHAIRGYPTCSDLWEALGLAYQRLGMYTAATKSYARAMELEDSSVFAMIESGNIFLMLGSYRKGIELFQQTLKLYPQNVSAQYSLASGLLALSKEYINTGAFVSAASLLEEAAEIAKRSSVLAGSVSCIWKLHGDIQLTYAKCLPWLEEGRVVENGEEAFTQSLTSWRQTCYSAAVAANHSYQRALHLAPWQANIYSDVAICVDLIHSLEENFTSDLKSSWQLPEKMSLGSLLLEGGNHEFWVTLGCLSCQKALKQHAFIKGLQLDVSLAVAWAYLGKLYREQNEKQLAQQAFDRARSIDPSLALPWAGMAADSHARGLTSDEPYESCLRAVQILPLAEFQIGLTQLAMLCGHLPSSQVFGAIQQAVQHAPYYPESHNLNGLVSEARFDYQSAVASYKLARYAMSTCTTSMRSHLNDLSINLARALCKAGNALDAVRELEVLKSKGSLDVEGLQIYAVSLWQLGRNDLALSVVRDLIRHASPMGLSSEVASISLVCRILFYMSGMESVTDSILKMPKEYFLSTKLCFVVSAIYALDQSNSLGSVVSASRRILSSQEEITEMHILIAFSKMLKHGKGHRLEFQSGVHHLRKAIHMYPNCISLRVLLSYLLLSSRQWEDTHVSNRCYVGSPPDVVDKGIRSANEILGSEAVACHAIGYCGLNYSFPTCKRPNMEGSVPIQHMQRWFHREPWNFSARHLLILNVLQKAREARYPEHSMAALKRMIVSALSSSFYLQKNKASEYQKFQLLLCASEISLQSGDMISCVSYAEDATELLLPDGYIFFAHLQLCRAHAADRDKTKLTEAYSRCLNLQIDCPVGWLSLKFIESWYELHIGSKSSESRFFECLSENDGSQNMWMALYNFVCGIIAMSAQDFKHAERMIAKACSLAGSESCLFLCYGAICMNLARQQQDSQYLSTAVWSLRKALKVSSAPLPFVSLLLAQAEASLGSKIQWEKNLRHEWLSWSAVMKPAELHFQMHLLAKRFEEGSEPLSGPESAQTPAQWILRAIHMNPSCIRYWRVLWKLFE